LEKVRGVAEPDEIYLLIASGGVYVDLSAAAIVEPDPRDLRLRQA